jgi:hypothetical protein
MCLLHRSACMDQRAHAPMVRLTGLARGPQGAMRGPCPFCLHSVQDLLFPPPFPAGGGRGSQLGKFGGMASPHRNLQRQRGAARRSSARSMCLHGAHEVTGALRTMQHKVTCMHARFEDTHRVCPFVTCLVTARRKRASEAQIPLRRLCGDQRRLSIAPVPPRATAAWANFIPGRCRVQSTTTSANVCQTAFL